MNGESIRVLIVDDEAPIRLTMSALLERQGYQVTAADSGEAALAVIYERPFELLLLDLKMPGLDGIQVAQRARERQPNLTIMILTGHGSLDSAMDAIHVDVFDYVLKTADPEYVLGRVRAAAEHHQAERRTQRVLGAFQSLANELGSEPVAHQPGGMSEQWFEVGDLRISTWSHTVRRGDETLNLTPTEMRVLACLAQRVGQVMTYQQIVQCAQGYAVEPIEAAELIKPHMYHLRQKLETDPANPQYILTVRGTGYLLSAPAMATK
ncbi:MAG TPA: response regulator transcription factor [Herpetosiphonaceae bacterium]